MPSRGVQRVQDAVHGLMEFRGMEAAVLELLNLKEVRRLRGIRQLGLAHLVFPSAEHSRFSHALGSAHIALRFSRHLEQTVGNLDDSLRVNEEIRRDLAVAALCHDIGHGPLSHAWEPIASAATTQSAFAETFGLQHALSPVKLQQKAEPSWHDLTGQMLLQHRDSEIRQALEGYESGLSARIAGILRGEYYVGYLPRVLDSDVDADRCDYLIRDAVMTGVAYGRYDIDWLISTATVGEHPDRGLVFGFDERKAMQVLEQVVVARRALYETVYRHKTVRAAEVMVERLFARLQVTADAHVDGLGGHDSFDAFLPVIAKAPFTYGSVVDVDDAVLDSLVQLLAAESPDPVANDLATRLVERRLFKYVPLNQEALIQFDQLPQALRTIFDEPEYYYASKVDTLRSFSKSEPKRTYVVGSSVHGLGAAHELNTVEGSAGAWTTRDLTSRNAFSRLWCAEEALPAVRSFING